jgi:hypothetical protein
VLTTHSGHFGFSAAGLHCYKIPLLLEAATETTMVKNSGRLAVVILLFSAGLVAGQNGAPPSSTPRQEPCWKQAGISQSVMEQRRGIERDAHSQVESVCQNSSLTPQQKQEQVREIRQQAEQKLDALITSEQQSSLHACQQQRGMNGSSHPGSSQPGSSQPGSSQPGSSNSGSSNSGYRRNGAGPCGNLGSPQGRQGPSSGPPQQPENSPQRN